MTTLREKSKVATIEQLKPVAHSLKSWFLSVGYNFMKSRTLKDEEEALIEDFTDFYLDCISKIENY